MTIRRKHALCIGVNHDPNAMHAEDDANRIARALWDVGYQVDVRDHSTIGNYAYEPLYDVISYSCEAIMGSDEDLMLFLNDPSIPSPWAIIAQLPTGNDLTIFDCCHVGSVLHADDEGTEGNLCLCASAGKSFNIVHGGSFFSQALVASIYDKKALPLGKDLTTFKEHVQRYADRLHRQNQVPYERQVVTEGWLL
jgi:hypothetical protein